MPSLFRDFRYGLRVLSKSPGFAIAAILVLALGVGANTAIFSVVNAVLLRPLPYQDSSRIMQIWHTPPAKSFPGITRFSVSPANYLDWREQNHVFEKMAAYGFTGLIYSGKDNAEMVTAAAVSAEFFDVLRVRPVLGRVFYPEEDQPGRGHVAILSQEFWQTRFGADPGIIDRDVTFNGERYKVVGVMAPKFKFPDWANVWVPTAWNNEKRAVRGNHNYLVIGRLKPGPAIDQAQAELTTISANLERQYPEDNKGWGAVIVPLHEETVGDIRAALLVLLGAVAFVLLIACANVANLVLAKTIAQRKEIAIRTALGASRGRVVQQVLSETLLLSIGGGLLGIVLARFGLSAIVQFFGDKLPRSAEITLDARVLAFTAVIAVIAGLLAGVIPAVRFTKGDVNEALKQGQRGSSDAQGSKTRGFLVVSEVALSLVLLVGAGLMIRSLWLLRAVSPGVDPKDVLTMSLMIPGTRFSTPEKAVAYFDDVLRHVRAVPGVESAGLVDDLPLSGNGSHQPFSIEGRPMLPMSEQPEVDVRLISPGYMKAMRTPILRGRDVSEADVAGGPGVVLISESLAKTFWPNEDALGKRLTLTFFPSGPREVIGIVGDVKPDSLDQTRPAAMLYHALSQITPPDKESWRSFGMSLAVRTNSDPRSSASAITEAIHQVDSGVPVLDVMAMEDLISNSLAPQRFNLLLLGSFAFLSLFLAAVGIYSVLAYSVRRRVREIGIRMALGAHTADVLKLVLVDGMKPTLLGIAIGLAASLALGHVVSSLIYGIRATDPLTFVAVAALLVTVGLFATAVPAYRATQVEPTKSLREE